MGIQGVPWTATEKEITDAIKASNGLVSHAAKRLGVHHSTIYEKIEEWPWLKDYIAKVRQQYVESKLDNAEATLDYAVNQIKEDLSNAVKASIYTLNNLGKSRNYAHPEVAKAVEERGLVDMIKDGTVQIATKSKD